MGEIKRNGVDVATLLLTELAALGGEVGTSELARNLNIPKASFYRIVRSLAEFGVVVVNKGQISVGTVPRDIVQRHASSAGPGAPAVRRGSSRIRTAPSSRSSEPIALSAPLARRQSGRFRIGFSNAGMDNAWRVALVHAVEHAISGLGTAVGKLSIRHAGDDRCQQVADLHALIDEGVDGLIVSAVDPAYIADALDRARANSIPVVLVDRGVAEGVPYHSLVWADNEQIGHIHALWLAEKLGGQGNILMLGGKQAALPARKRMVAANTVLSLFPGINILDVCWTGWDRAAARQFVQEAIARYGDRIDGVWCDSGLQGSGSMEAFLAARRGSVPLHTGGDLNLAYKLAVRHRIPLAAVDYPPAMGAVAAWTLHAALSGNWVPKTVHVASEVILTRGQGTRSVRATLRAEDHVRWELPDDLVLASGLGIAYNPKRFRVHYPGNKYNRSAAQAELGALS
jgi:ribose transport system substrate-binding protein